MGIVNYYVGDIGDLIYARHGAKYRRDVDRYSGKETVLFGDWHVGTTKFYGIQPSDNPNVLVREIIP